MAREDAGGMFRSKATDYKLGDYNGVTEVPSSTTFYATGSKSGAGFIVENATNVVIHCAGGGILDTDQIITKTLYPIGVKKVVIGGTGIVHVLHR